MKTEEEARKCWCPFVDAGGIDIPGEQYDARGFCRNPTFAHCIASECMAWRTAGRLVPAADAGGIWDGKSMKPADEDKGYCGLAGKP